MLVSMPAGSNKTVYQRLEADLAALAAQSRRRRLAFTDRSDRLIERDGQRLVNLAGNDYLALSQHPHVIEAARTALAEEGTGAGASRLITGSLTRHAGLEQRFAAFKHAEAALLLPTGYLANLAALTALAGPGDTICLDKLNHASLIDAAHMTGATVRTFPHRNYDKLERLLDRHARSTSTAATSHDTSQPSASHWDASSNESRAGHAFIVTDSVFSMDGDVADLPGLCDLAERYDAMLIVDEAHATGLLGDHGAGLAESQQVADRVDVTISTASKGLGSLGGLITARQLVIDAIINHARSAIYTTAAPPAQAAAIDAALDVVEREPERRRRLHELSEHLRRELSRLGWVDEASRPTEASLTTPIVPIVVGGAERALALSEHLRQAGLLAPAIRYPTVPPGSERVRLSLRCDLTDRDINRLTDALARFNKPAAR